MTRKTQEKDFKEVLKSLYEKMKDKNIINISLLCSTVFLVGVSLNIPVAFYPKEALHKGVSVTQSGNEIRRCSKQRDHIIIDIFIYTVIQ